MGERDPTPLRFKMSEIVLVGSVMTERHLRILTPWRPKGPWSVPWCFFSGLVESPTGKLGVEGQGVTLKGGWTSVFKLGTDHRLQGKGRGGKITNPSISRLGQIIKPSRRGSPSCLTKGGCKRKGPQRPYCSSVGTTQERRKRLTSGPSPWTPSGLEVTGQQGVIVFLKTTSGRKIFRPLILDSVLFTIQVYSFFSW